MVVGRAGGRRDTPRRTGNEGRNVVAVATPSCAVGRPRHAPTSRDVASGLRAVAPACGAIGVTCAPAQAAQWRGCGAGWDRGPVAPARALQFPIHAPRSPAFRSAARRTTMYRLLTLAHYAIRFLDFTMVNYGRVSAETSKNRRMTRKYVPRRLGSRSVSRFSSTPCV